MHGISLNLKGGYVDDTVDAIEWELEAEDIFSTLNAVPAVVGFEPIDLSSGAFLYDHDDLTMSSWAGRMIWR